jgi:hypothetical protein
VLGIRPTLFLEKPALPQTAREGRGTREGICFETVSFGNLSTKSPPTRSLNGAPSGVCMLFFLLHGERFINRQIFPAGV